MNNLKFKLPHGKSKLGNEAKQVQKNQVAPSDNKPVIGPSGCDEAANIYNLAKTRPHQPSAASSPRRNRREEISAGCANAPRLVAKAPTCTRKCDRLVGIYGAPTGVKQPAHQGVAGSAKEISARLVAGAPTSEELSKALENISIDITMHNIRMSSLIYDIKQNDNIIFGKISYKLHQLTKKTEEDFKCINMSGLNLQQHPQNQKELQIEETSNNVDDYRNTKDAIKLIDGMCLLIEDVFAEISDYYTNRNAAHIVLPDYNVSDENDILTVDELSLYLKTKGKSVRVVSNTYLNQFKEEMENYKLDKETEDMFIP